MNTGSVAVERAEVGKSYHQTLSTTRRGSLAERRGIVGLNEGFKELFNSPVCGQESELV